MKMKKFLIANGNSTLLIWDCPSWKRKKVIGKYLGEVEHLGFVSAKNGLPKLTMMGNELCMNATLALASRCSKSGSLFTSGVNEPISYQNSNKKTLVKITLPYKQINNIILFPGIGFYYDKMIQIIESELRKKLSNLCNKYKLPAFGLISYQKNKLIPYVYVQKTNSLCKETACGSGSVALNILIGKNEIVQPTGQIINVQSFGSRFTVGAKVVKIEERTIL